MTRRPSSAPRARIRSVSALDQLANRIWPRSNGGRCGCAGSSKVESCSSMRYAAKGAYDLVHGAEPDWHSSFARARGGEPEWSSS